MDLNMKLYSFYLELAFYIYKFRYAKRKVLNATEVLKRDKFVEAALAGDKDLFEELRRFKGAPQKVSSKVDGNTDPDSIADHFKNIYSGLYNRTGTKEPLENLSEILTNPNCEDDQITNSSENLLRCVAQIAEADKNSKAKSLSEVLSKEFAVGLSNPRLSDV